MTNMHFWCFTRRGKFEKYEAVPGVNNANNKKNFYGKPKNIARMSIYQN